MDIAVLESRRNKVLAGITPIDRYATIREVDLSEIAAEDIKIPEKYIHDELHPEIWRTQKIHPNVRRRLLDIAEEFFKFLKLDTEVEDIWLTGSMANYNYGLESDVDLHVLLEFKKISEDKNLVKEYVDSKKIIWNDRHSVTIFGHEIEVYVQDIQELHHSPAVYSLKEDRWLLVPASDEVQVDRQAVRNKVLETIRRIEKIEELIPNEPETALNQAEKLFEKLKKMRRCGLKKEGEYSIENLAFKFLRSNDYLKKLKDNAIKAKDMTLSIGGSTTDWQVPW